MSKEPQKQTRAEGLFVLTRKELEILRLAGQGLTHKKIACRLFNSPETIRTHLKHIYRKLQVHNKVEAVSKLKSPQNTPFG